jgi:hypothetical protein
MQWYGGAFDKDHQAWTHSYGYYQHTRLGFTPTKNTLWILVWHLSQHEIFSFHGAH